MPFRYLVLYNKSIVYMEKFARKKALEMYIKDGIIDASNQKCRDSTQISNILTISEFLLASCLNC